METTTTMMVQITFIDKDDSFPFKNVQSRTIEKMISDCLGGADDVKIISRKQFEVETDGV